MASICDFGMALPELSQDSSARASPAEKASTDRAAAMAIVLCIKSSRIHPRSSAPMGARIVADETYPGLTARPARFGRRAAPAAALAASRGDLTQPPSPA